MIDYDATQLLIILTLAALLAWRIYRSMDRPKMPSKGFDSGKFHAWANRPEPQAILDPEHLALLRERFQARADELQARITEAEAESERRRVDLVNGLIRAAKAEEDLEIAKLRIAELESNYPPHDPKKFSIEKSVADDPKYRGDSRNIIVVTEMPEPCFAAIGLNGIESHHIGADES